MSQMHVQLPTGRQVHDTGKSEARVWPCILICLNHLEEAQTILAQRSMKCKGPKGH